jgi:acyl-coenzyme A synthetase/AMP-(fatty) acid ligase
MRHFLALSLSKVMLAASVLQATAEGLLKALARIALALAARLAPARLGAIPLPMVAALAQAQLLAATGAIKDSVAGLDDGSTSSSQKPGQCPPIASLSGRDKNTS